jgi:hypothetical protein
MTVRFARPLLAALALSALLAGCSGDKVSTVPVPTTSAPSSVPGSASARTSAPAATQAAPKAVPKVAPKSAPTTAPQAGGQTQAQVGDTLDLTGNDSGSRMAVVVTRVVDPAAAADDFLTASPDDRLVSVQFQLQNVGSAVYSDAPSNSAVVVDSSGQGYDSTIDDSAAGPSFPTPEHIAPGGTALGYVTFEVPDGVRVALVQFTLDSGFADDTGQWTVNRTVPGSAPEQPATPPAPAPAPATTSADDPGQTVQDYYADINAHDYNGAWNLGGKNLDNSYQDFTAGFAGTVSDAVTVDSVSGDTVSVDLDALQTDGSHRHFSGTYTVSDGAIVSANIS